MSVLDDFGYIVKAALTGVVAGATAIWGAFGVVLGQQTTEVVGGAVVGAAGVVGLVALIWRLATDHRREQKIVDQYERLLERAEGRETELLRQIDGMEQVLRTYREGGDGGT